MNCSRSYGNTINLRLSTIHFPAGLLHFSLQPLDLYQVTRIERQRRVVTIRLVCAEASISSFFATLAHRRRQPQLLKVPVKLSQVADWRKVFAGRNRSFVINYPAGCSSVTLHLRLLRLLRLRNQSVHVNVYRRLEESDIAAI